MNRLEHRLALPRGPGLAPYFTAGDGGLDTTVAVLGALDRAGASCVELGVPFSDPIADGPVLQAAAQRALDAGTSFDDVLEVIKSFRALATDSPQGDLPIAIFSYANPLLRHGWRRSCELIAAAGGDGLLVPDLPVEEASEMRAAANDAGLCPIFFVAPTTSDRRVELAASSSRGFLYVIGRVGVTGSETLLDDRAVRFLSGVHNLTDLPLAVGFGLRTPQQVKAVTKYAQLAVVGSALVNHIFEAGAGDPDRAAIAAEGFIHRLGKGIEASWSSPASESETGETRSGVSR